VLCAGAGCAAAAWPRPARAQYRTAAFLAKNRDFVVGEHQALLQASARPFVAALFPPEAEANYSAPVRGSAWRHGGKC